MSDARRHGAAIHACVLHNRAAPIALTGIDPAIALLVHRARRQRQAIGVDPETEPILARFDARMCDEHARNLAVFAVDARANEHVERLGRARGVWRSAAQQKHERTRRANAQRALPLARRSVSLLETTHPMSFLRIDVGFPVAALSLAALCIVALRAVEAYAGRRARERTTRIISLVGASESSAAGRKNSDHPSLTD